MENYESPKIFCVGAGKTGTTSLKELFRSQGFSVGDQSVGELLLHEWGVRNFAPIIAFARTAQMFQDMPFSCPFTFQALDMEFPNSKFILSVRRNAEVWYDSLTRFHTKIVGKGRLPTADDLREFAYRYKGWILEALTLVYGVSEESPYDKATLISAYETHNKGVARYFENRNDLLVVDLAERDAPRRILEYVGLGYNGERMPHLNRSIDV